MRDAISPPEGGNLSIVMANCNLSRPSLLPPNQLRTNRVHKSTRFGWFVLGTWAVAMTFALTGCTGESSSGGGEQPGVGLPEADPPPRNSGESADVVLDWMALHLDMVRRESVSAPVATRVFANAALAIEAAVSLATGGEALAIEGMNYPEPPSELLNLEVATSAAAAQATRELFPSRDATRSADALEAHHRRAFGSANDEASVVFGRAVADAVIARAATDVFDTVERRLRPEPDRPGGWEPTPPAFQRALEPGWGDLRPLVANDTDCPVADPVAYSEDPESTFFAEAMAVFNITGALTADQRRTAQYWNDRPGFSFTPSGHWVHIALTELEHELQLGDTNVSLNNAADLYALLSVAQADTFIANWVVKYRTDVIRPVSYLRQLVDPDWLPALNTPPFPEYPSGHSAGSAAAAEVLTKVLGEREFTDTTHASIGWPARTYASYDDAAAEASRSRLYGGIHYPMGSQAGAKQGRCIAEVVLERLDRSR